MSTLCHSELAPLMRSFAEIMHFCKIFTSESFSVSTCFFGIHDRLSLDLSQLMRLFPSLTHLLAIIVNLILLQAKVKFILLILYKYTLYRLKPKININKQTNFDFCFSPSEQDSVMYCTVKQYCCNTRWRDLILYQSKDLLDHYLY